MIVFVLRCDGRRDYIERAIASAEANVHADFARRFIINDSGDPDYASWLNYTFPVYECIHHVERRGNAAGMQTALKTVVASGADYAFMTEDDFVFNQPVDVMAIARLLDSQPQLAQLVLKRNPVSPAEIAAGGQIEQAPNEFDDYECEYGAWVEMHPLPSRVFSCNPMLFRRDAIDAALASGLPMHECGLTDALRARDYRFAYWGKRDGPQMCEHIGTYRLSAWTT
jgi:hypothetical protein